MSGLTERQILDLEYREEHCPHCDREYETRLQVCSDDVCAEVHNQ